MHRLVFLSFGFVLLLSVPHNSYALLKVEHSKEIGILESRLMDTVMTTLTLCKKAKAKPAMQKCLCDNSIRLKGNFEAIDSILMKHPDWQKDGGITFPRPSGSTGSIKLAPGKMMDKLSSCK
jgi:hypothetical protein